MTVLQDRVEVHKNENFVSLLDNSVEIKRHLNEKSSKIMKLLYCLGIVSSGGNRSIRLSRNILRA